MNVKRANVGLLAMTALWSASLQAQMPDAVVANPNEVRNWVASNASAEILRRRGRLAGYALVWLGESDRPDSVKVGGSAGPADGADAKQELLRGLVDTARFEKDRSGWHIWHFNYGPDFLKPRGPEASWCPPPQAFRALAEHLASSSAGPWHWRVAYPERAGTQFHVPEPPLSIEVDPSIRDSAHCEPALQDWLRDGGMEWISQVNEDASQWDWEPDSELPPEAVAMVNELIESRAVTIRFERAGLAYNWNTWEFDTSGGYTWSVWCPGVDDCRVEPVRAPFRGS